MNRFPILVLALLALAFLFPAVAVAQEEVQPVPVIFGVDVGAVGAVASLIIGALVGLFFVGARLVDRMAARPALDGWDDAKATIDKLKPYAEKIKQWADPDDPAVPPSPGNPSGRSA
jgi:hypothetical protein